MATITRDDTRITRALWSSIRKGESGATVSATNTQLPTIGYYVGGEAPAKILPVEEVTPDDVAAFVSANPTVELFGMWVWDGMVYLDAVTHVANAQSAGRLGRERGEQEIFNVTTGECEAV